jgi:hypothetical protein
MRANQKENPGGCANSPRAWHPTQEVEMHQESISRDYESFLSTKRPIVPNRGITIPDSALHPDAFPFQRDLTRFAARKGRAGLFAGTGMGKTIMQLMWAGGIGHRVLDVAPLGVTHQTVKEGERWGIPVTYARSQEHAASEGITITNYEMVDHFDPDAFDAVVLDESSILKGLTSATRKKLGEMFAHTPMRLCCTATPAPNDIAEIANHAEFLGIMSRTEMLAAFFVHDDAGWRLKRHAIIPFYRWLASWAVCITKPSDLGYPDDGYILPPLTVTPHLVHAEYVPDGQLFATGLHGITDRVRARKSTVASRLRKALDIITSEPSEPWVVWVGLNDEGRQIARALGSDAVLVEGSDDPDEKADRLAGFAEGRHRIAVTKGSIAGFGMNWQHCARELFFGLDDSWERYFQQIRRCWRFGQTRPVEVHIVISDAEQDVLRNVQHKEAQATEMQRQLIAHIAEFEKEEIGAVTARMDYAPAREMEVPAWLA